VSRVFGKALASVLVVALVLEVFLQLFGDRLPTRLNSYYITSKEGLQKGQVIVLCLGDSVTAWGMENSYPAILQLFLDKAAPGKYFVINAAKLGETSKSLLDTFKLELEKARPDYVISMIGQNDYKLTGSAAFWTQIRLISVLEHLLRVGVNSLKGILQSYKESKPAEVYQPEPSNNWDNIEAQIQTYLHAEAPVERYYAVLNYLMDEGARASQKAYYLSITLATEGLKKWPGDQILADLRGLAAASIPGYAHTEEYLKFAYDHGSKHPVIFVYYAKLLKRSGQAANGLRVAKELIKNEGGLIGRNKQIIEAEFPHLKSEEPVHPSEPAEVITAGNYKKLLQLTKEHQSHLIILPYPMRSLEETKKILGEEAGFTILSFGNFFEASKLSYDEYFMDRSAVDFGHLRPKSAEYIAKIAAEIILEKSRLSSGVKN